MKFVKYGFNGNTGKDWAIVEISYNGKYELWYKQGNYIKNWGMDAQGSLDKMIEIFNRRMSEIAPKKDACYLDLLAL